ncbi:MAG TPA: MCE family protein [Nocardioides sp.]|uniref:MCE family protein n=1 Tax=Nocardioides sp. TaxID=35761 RepID=UPI002E326FC5|nr:MCE family protein [Nocardioides sp.]HEX5088718.1 MCE family protein [Nocardioides sp.]
MKRLRLLLGLLLGSVVLSACDFDIYSLPLPGGTDVGDNPIHVTVQFRDVLDLVPKSTVKVNDVSVGQVQKITLDGYTAEVQLELRNDTELPDNAIAEIRQTSLLGEKFVSLAAPETGASHNPLKDGDVIPLERTGRNPEVEEVLGALSLILNGGGVAQLKTIAQELNKTIGGREDDVRSVLSQINTFTSQLDTNKGQIVDAIEALNRLAVSAHQQEANIDQALDELPSALTSIDGQRQDLVRMLQALDQLSGVGVRVIKASKTATIDSLRQLQPVLNQLAASGDDFVNAFNVFLTYPFVDEVVGRDPQVARNLHMGDYTNLSITLELDLSKGLLPTNPTDVLPTELDPGQLVQAVLDCISSGDLASAACRKVLNTPEALLKLKQLCQEPGNRNKTVCVLLNTVPGLPALPGATTNADPLSQLGDQVGGLLNGLGRSATGPWNDAAHGGPTMAQLQAAYDPSLVNLLVPELVVPKTGARTTAKGGGAK